MAGGRINEIQGRWRVWSWFVGPIHTFSAHAGKAPSAMGRRRWLVGSLAHPYDTATLEVLAGYQRAPKGTENEFLNLGTRAGREESSRFFTESTFFNLEGLGRMVFARWMGAGRRRATSTTMRSDPTRSRTRTTKKVKTLLFLYLFFTVFQFFR